MHVLLLLLKLLVVVMGLEHVGIAWLEMRGAPALQARVFNMAPRFVQQKEAQIALANQGIYNLMVGLLLLGSLLTGAGTFSACAFGLMLLIFVVGVYGGATVAKRIYWVQAVPALVGLMLGLSQLLA